ncbi:hypothetical protein ACTFIR_006599 [Dictyostelium discoideum]
MMYEVNEFLDKFDDSLRVFKDQKNYIQNLFDENEDYFEPEYYISDEKESDARFKSIRIIIENIFAHIKKYSITSLTFRFKNKTATTSLLDYHHKVWCVVAFLVNSYVEIRKNE